METFEIIREELIKAGWNEEPRIYKSTDIRMTYKQNGNHLEIDNRPKEKYLWLWLVGRNDRHCIGIPYSDNIMKVLEKITSMIETLNYENYLSNYMNFQMDFKVMMMMWEQFEAKERIS